MKKVMTLPNVLSVLRMLMVPIIILFILNINNFLFPYMIFFYFFTIFLDFLDGFIARRFSLQSELGKILDPVADKILVLSILIALVIKTDFPLWLAITIFLRDALILWASIVLFRGKRMIQPSLVIGKVTFALLSLLIFVFILDLHQAIDLILFKRFLIVLSFSFLIWSGIEYGKVYMREMHVRKKSNPCC
jgi:cardiolipin synthase (CMP-forming)